MRRAGPRWGWSIGPGSRKIHAAPMPTAGGLAIWLGVVAPLAAGQLALWLAAGATGLSRRAGLPESIARHLPGLAQQSGRLWALLAGGDGADVARADRRPPRARLASSASPSQTAVAVAMVRLGWRHEPVHRPAAG